jgi:hypothetical protein
MHLGLVDGRGVAVGEVSGSQVPERQHDRLVAGHGDVDDVVGPVDVGDRATGAVEDSEAVVVAQGEHLVADSEADVAAGELIVAHLARRLETLASTVVEVGDLLASGGEHHGLFAVGAGVMPLVHELVLDSVGVGRVVDAAVGLIGVERLVGVALPELRERSALPRLVLASVLGELRGFDPFGESGEGAAGVDLGELAGVADEHDLGAGSLGVFEEPEQLASADHGGLIDHDYVLRRESVGVGSVEVAEQPIERR